MNKSYSQQRNEQKQASRSQPGYEKYVSNATIRWAEDHPVALKEMKTIVDKESKRKNIADLNTLMNEKDQWVKLEGLVAFAKNNTLQSIQSDTYRIQTRLQATLDWIIKVIMSSLRGHLVT